MLDVYAEITQKICDSLSRNIVPWRQPWCGAGRCISFATGREYSLLNTLLLGQRSGEFATFAQIKAAGGRVRKGEKASFVVFWKIYESTNEDGEQEKKFVLRRFNVFNIEEQCDGIQPRWRSSLTEEPGKDLKPNEVAEKIISDYIARTGIKIIIEKSNQAYYQPGVGDDIGFIHLPALSQYKDLSEYYSTAMHEIIHSSLKPLGIYKPNMNKSERAIEELRAEIGSCFLMNHIGMQIPETFENSCSYIQSWISVLKNDHRLLVRASSAAEKAARFVLGENEEKELNPDDEGA